MRVIYNKLIPFGHYFAINLFGLVFARKGHGTMSEKTLNHEFIHTLQMREMLYIFFYLWYIVEWLFLLIKYRNSNKAYFHISFEMEAYAHQDDLQYVQRRKHFAWKKFYKTKKDNE